MGRRYRYPQRDRLVRAQVRERLLFLRLFVVVIEVIDVVQSLTLLDLQQSFTVLSTVRDDAFQLWQLFPVAFLDKPNYIGNLVQYIGRVLITPVNR